MVSYKQKHSNSFHKNTTLIELFRISPADEIPKEDTAALLKELCDPEDEDGFFPYKPFIERLTAKN